MVKNLPIMDIPADELFLKYAGTVSETHITQGGTCMRHFYFRLILGVVFAICAVYSFIKANIPFALMYVVLGGVFLYSAYTIWKKNKDNRG
jgi:hypothetical protein